MTQTFDKEKAVACGTRLKIRVSAAVDRLILAKIRCRGLQRRTAGTDATVQPGFVFYTRNLCELSTQFAVIGARSFPSIIGTQRRLICVNRSQRSNGKASAKDLRATNNARFRQKPV